MKLNRLETHDRYQHFIKDQSVNIFLGAEECLKKNPLSLAIQEKCPYVYLFAHPRTADDGVTKRMLWQPRISKPSPQTNSYLFRAISNTDTLEIVWLIPPAEMWPQYAKKNVTESSLVCWSIDQYKSNRAQLALPHGDDLSEESAKMIMRKIIQEHIETLRQANAVVSSTALELPEIHSSDP